MELQLISNKKIVGYSLNPPHMAYLKELGQSVLYSDIKWHGWQDIPEVSGAH